MLTLLHEDIYVYIDPLVEETKYEIGNDVEFINDSIGSIADFGIFDIKITSGSFTSLKVTVGEQNIIFNTPSQVNDTFILDFRENHFTKNGSLIFPDNLFELQNDRYETILVSFIGVGEADIQYTYSFYEENFMDVAFVESISVDENIEHVKKTNIFNKEKFAKGEKKGYGFSITCIWNREEEDRFNGIFRMRLVDEEGTKLENLANCRVTSKQKSSSSDGDYTFTISGECEEVI